MERIAFGYLRMSIHDWNDITPKELQWRLEQEQLREDREFERLAQLACWVINPWLGKQARPLRVRDLLRRGPVKSDNFWEKDE